MLWTAGSSPVSKEGVSEHTPKLPFPATNKGAVRTDPTLRVQDHPRVFALGDVSGSEAADPSTSGSALPATAQVWFDPEYGELIMCIVYAWQLDLDMAATTFMLLCSGALQPTVYGSTYGAVKMCKLHQCAVYTGRPTRLSEHVSRVCISCQRHAKSRCLVPQNTLPQRQSYLATPCIPEV